eukprot:1318517-Prymnesium_polylepis.1
MNGTDGRNCARRCCRLCQTAMPWRRRRALERDAMKLLHAARHVNWVPHARPRLIKKLRFGQVVDNLADDKPLPAFVL